MTPPVCSVIRVPKFDLSKEATGGLWLGMVFFSFLALLLVFRGVLPWLPKAGKEPSGTEVGAGRIGPRELLPPFAREVMKRDEAARAKPPPDMLGALPWVISGVVLVGGTVIPIARELRRRHRARAIA